MKEKQKTVDKHSFSNNGKSGLYYFCTKCQTYVKDQYCPTHGTRYVTIKFFTNNHSTSSDKIVKEKVKKVVSAEKKMVQKQPVRMVTAKPVQKTSPGVRASSSLHKSPQEVSSGVKVSPSVRKSPQKVSSEVKASSPVRKSSQEFPSRKPVESSGKTKPSPVTSSAKIPTTEVLSKKQPALQEKTSVSSQNEAPAEHEPEAAKKKIPPVSETIKFPRPSKKRMRVYSESPEPFKRFKRILGISGILILILGLLFFAIRYEKAQRKEALVTRIFDRAESLYEAGKYQKALSLYREVVIIHPGSETSKLAQKRIQVIESRLQSGKASGTTNTVNVKELMQKLQKAYERQRYSRPQNDNALMYIDQILKIDPENKTAREILNNILNYFRLQASIALQSKQFSRALQYYEIILKYEPNNPRTRETYNILKKLVRKTRSPGKTRGALEKKTPSRAPIKKGPVLENTQQGNLTRVFPEVKKNNSPFSDRGFTESNLSDYSARREVIAGISSDSLNRVSSSKKLYRNKTEDLIRILNFVDSVRVSLKQN